MPKKRAQSREYIIEELAQIRRLLHTATAELERGNLSQAHEALLAARRTYELLAAQVAEWSRKESFTLQLGRAEQGIARSERRLAAHVTTLNNA